MEIGSDSYNRPFMCRRLLFCLALFGAFLIHSAPAKIYGGSKDKIGSIPYIVSLSSSKLEDFNGFFCGGTIISPSWILTAAHCANHVESNELFVRAGSQYRHKGGQVRNVTRAIPHELYNVETREDNDFALLELSSPFALGGTVQTMKLSTFRDKYAPGEMCLAAGWGKTKNSKGPMKHLRSVMVPLVSHERCKKAHAVFENVISNQMMCAGAPGIDSCVGDSGGPLVCRNKLVGVISWGRGCGIRTLYGVYANVSTVREWIAFHSGI